MNGFTMSVTLNGFTINSQFEVYGEGDDISPYVEQFKAAVRAIPLTRWQRFVLRVRGIKL